MTGRCPNASTSRRSAARRTRSTPTRSSPPCSPTGSSPRPRPAMPISSSSTRARSSKRRARSRSTSRSRSRTRSGPAPSSWSPGAWPSGTARSWPRRCPRPTPSSASPVKARSRTSCSSASRPGVRDLLELPRPAPTAPWAYVKIAEGCDRACAFCAIPSFRGAQRSRTQESIELEARALVEQGVSEIVLVAQDLAWYGRDAGEPGAIVDLLRRLDALSASGLTRLRLLYLYPSEVRDPLITTMFELPTVVPYFDLSLQHASAGLLRRMKRWGNGDRFLTAIEKIRAQDPDGRVPVVVHRRLPGRDGSGPRRTARLPRRGPARLGRVLPVLRRGRHGCADARRQGRRPR